MFAVIKTGGKQYRVAEEDKLKIEKLSGEEGDIVTFDNVLMLGSDKDVTIGEPLVEGASVAAEIVEQGRARKIIVFKKKRRQTYRRKNGHRQMQTTVRITEILTGGKKPSKTAAAAKPAPKVTEKDADNSKAKAEKPKVETKNSDTEVTPLFTAPEGAADDLKKISGVGPVLEKKLNALGIKTFEQVAAFTEDDIARVDEVLNFKGRIERDNWLEQAKELAAAKS